MNWIVTHQYDRRAAHLADRHYSRQKPGTPKFSPPGRKLVLITRDASAVWVTSWPLAEYVRRDYADAWICTLFRNESPILSSSLILEAIAITRWKYGSPPASGMITMIDPTKIQSCNPGYCFKVAGFQHIDYTKRAGLHILQLASAKIPQAASPLGVLPWLEEVSI